MYEVDPPRDSPPTRMKSLRERVIVRPFELLLCAMVALSAVSLLVSPNRRFFQALIGICVVIAVVHAILEGAHWQMIPGYAAVVLLGAGGLWLGKGRPVLRVAVGVAACLLVACTGVLSYAFPMFRLPKPTGSYPVGTTLLYLTDNSRLEDAVTATPARPRELMVQLWYPAEPSRQPFAPYRRAEETQPFTSYQSVLATNSRLNVPVSKSGGPFPVILLNHSWGGRRTNDTFLAEELASHGYLVASIDHTYNAGLVAFPDGRVIRSEASSAVSIPDASTPDQVRAVWNKELVKSTADERFVLDWLDRMSRESGTQWTGRINANLAGAIGHSFGGAAATEICAEDPRVRGAINMDGWFFHAIQARGAHQPLMMITGGIPDLSPNTPKGTEALLDLADYIDWQRSMQRFGGYVVVVKGAEHGDFTDQPLVSPLRRFSYAGAVPARRVHEIVRNYVLAFFDKTIRGADPAILRSGRSPYPEVGATFWPDSSASGSPAMSAVDLQSPSASNPPSGDRF